MSSILVARNLGPRLAAVLGAGAPAMDRFDVSFAGIDVGDLTGGALPASSSCSP